MHHHVHPEIKLGNMGVSPPSQSSPVKGEEGEGTQPSRLPAVGPCFRRGDDNCVAASFAE